MYWEYRKHLRTLKTEEIWVLAIQSGYAVTQVKGKPRIAHSPSRDERDEWMDAANDVLRERE